MGKPDSSDLSDASREATLALAHALRTPLTSIVLGLGMLDEGALGALSDAQREVVRALVGEAARLSLLVDRALQTDRLGAYAGPIERTPMAQLRGRPRVRLHRLIAGRGRPGRWYGTAMNKKGEARVLVVDDEESIRKMLRVCLEGAGYKVALAASGESGIEASKRAPPDLALIDLRLGGMDGIAVTRALAQEVPSAAVILMTAYATIDNAVDAMRAGAADYLPKPFTPAQVLHAVSKTEGAARLRAELAELKSAPHRGIHPRFETKSIALRDALTVATRVAATDATVLLLGETGTGKGVLSRHIHALSPRAQRPFVTVNCAVISPSLIENELFGHAKGSFTGADSARAGYVEAASNGTLFLDEVGDLPREAQGKLLRLLEEHEYVRIGDTEPRGSEARVIAATHRDLRAAVSAGTFREDLFYRLNVVALRVPALRERGEDIPELAEAIVAGLSAQHRREPLRIEPAAAAALAGYRWPGNLRELVNVLERAVILASGGALTPDLLPEELRAAVPSRASLDDATDESLEAAERRHITAVLARHPTLDSAAKSLGVDPSTLYRKRERYGLK